MEKNKLDDIISKIESLTAIELAELVKTLEEKFGISASSAPAPAATGAGQETKEEKTSFNVILKSAGSSKINVIKVVKEIMVIGLKEAKDVVDGAPKTIKEGVKKEEAEEIEKKLKQAGAETELQ